MEYLGASLGAGLAVLEGELLCTWVQEQNLALNGHVTIATT